MPRADSGASLFIHEKGARKHGGDGLGTKGMKKREEEGAVGMKLDPMCMRSEIKCRYKRLKASSETGVFLNHQGCTRFRKVSWGAFLVQERTLFCHGKNFGPPSGPENLSSSSRNPPPFQAFLLLFAAAHIKNPFSTFSLFPPSGL